VALKAELRECLFLELPAPRVKPNIKNWQKLYIDFSCGTRNFTCGEILRYMEEINIFCSKVG
jgi:hypothetical protein